MHWYKYYIQFLYCLYNSIFYLYNIKKTIVSNFENFRFYFLFFLYTYAIDVSKKNIYIINYVDLTIITSNNKKKNIIKNIIFSIFNSIFNSISIVIFIVDIFLSINYINLIIVQFLLK